MSTRDLLATLLPRPYDATEADLDAWLITVAAQIDALLVCADTLQEGYLLGNAELLVDWERLLALPAGRLTNGQRIAQIKAELVKTGGLSRAYFIRLAAALGYTITIGEPLPVPLGQLRCGQRLTSIERWWFWEVTVVATGWQMRCTDSCDSRLITAPTTGLADLETIINDLKPAHTFVRFV